MHFACGHEIPIEHHLIGCGIDQEKLLWMVLPAIENERLLGSFGLITDMIDQYAYLRRPGQGKCADTANRQNMIPDPHVFRPRQAIFESISYFIKTIR